MIEIKNLCKTYSLTDGSVEALKDVSLSIPDGDVFGIIGMSGAGKSTLVRCINMLERPTAGSVVIDGKDLTKMTEKELRAERQSITMIFQGFNLLMQKNCLRNVCFPLELAGVKKAEATKKAQSLLELVGLPADSVRKFPHEFSGGQRQRLCIARALAVNPKLIVCDECVSALDVSIQAQIINLLMKLQRQLGIALVFVSHDLRVVRHISTHVAVMYLGRVVEYAPTEELFSNPAHPYTRALLSAVPLPDPDARAQRIVLKGELPSPIAVPSGCPFHTRCYAVQERCSSEVPQERDVNGCGHLCRCLLCEEKIPAAQP